MKQKPASDFNAILSKGGEDCVALLQFCVRSITIEPIFVFLAREYRLRPTHAAALALYDMFCVATAPARLAATQLLTPQLVRLAAPMQTIRMQWQQARLASPAMPSALPHRSLFDALLEVLQTDLQSSLISTAAGYDSQRHVSENLPEGRMTASQRHFVDTVWLPVVRPQLVAAGFWRIATIS